MAFQSLSAPQSEGRLADPSWQAHRVRNLQRAILLLLALAAANAYLTRHCLAVANTTMQAELGINNEQFGLLYSAFSIGYLLCQVPGGWLGQRIGVRRALPLLSLLWSAMTVVTAVVATLPALVSARLVFGLAQGGLVPNQAKVLNDWFPAEKRGSASGAIVVAMSVGSVASLWLTSWLMQYYAWRTVFHAYALIGVAWAVAFYLVFRPRPADAFAQPGQAPSEPPEEAAEGAGARGVPLRSILASRSVWGLAGQGFFRAAGYNLLVTFMPALLEFAYKISKEQAGALTSWPLIGVIVGSMLGGRLIDRLHRQTGSKRISRGGVSITALVLTAALLMAAPWAGTAHQLAALMAIAALVTGLSQPAPWAATIDIGGRSSAVVMGCMNSGSCLAGILISPLIGRLLDSIKAAEGDWSLVILVHAAFYLAAALCWLAVDPEKTLDAGARADAV